MILNIDSYKASHYLQYPPDLQYVSSYIESRGGLYPQVLFFGLQAFVKAYLQRPISMADIDEAEAFLLSHGEPFYRAGWEHILDQHGGYLPLSIEAVAEGAVLPCQQALLQVCNTCEQCYWLTSYIETSLLRAIWYPSTVATVSWYVKHMIAKALAQSADDLSKLPFMLHDFGARGASSYETAALGGLAHLVNFQGTDTVAGVLAAKAYYHEPMAGFSIPAAEHATMTCWGRDGEARAYAHMLQQFAKPGTCVAVVSDAYDLWHAIDTIWGQTLKERIQTSDAMIVIRPDSGDPVKVSCQVIELLMQRFGALENSKGYRQLPDYIRVIQGDGVEPVSIDAILQAMLKARLSVENIAFGMGGALLQKVHRDSLQFAMKASAAKIAGKWQAIYKDPVTDPNKRSKRGRLALLKEDDHYHTIPLNELGDRNNQLQLIYRDGELCVEHTLSQIRERADSFSAWGS